MQTEVKINSALCPLCGVDNRCGNIGLAGVEAASDAGKPCWCVNPTITFPEALLARVPAETKNSACICERCAKAFTDGYE